MGRSSRCGLPGRHLDRLRAFAPGSGPARQAGDLHKKRLAERGISAERHGESPSRQN